MTELNARIAAIPMPERVASLPINSKGFPIPWFVAADKTGSRDDLRHANQIRVDAAIRQKLCWICGHRLGTHLAFVVGPMCTINRISAEPPSHRVCAEYAVRACPFLSQPKMRRNDHDRDEELIEPAGIMIARNPGVTAIWMTRSFTIANGLCKIGDPLEVRWYREGRPATRAEIAESVESGLPTLRQACVDRADHAALDRMLKKAAPLFEAALA